MSVVRWEEPPLHGNVSTKYVDAADALRTEPGRWGVVVEGLATASGASLGNRIRIGRGPWAPAGTFEVRVVGPAGGKCTVYARYVGGAS